MRAAASAFVVEGFKSIGVALDAGLVPESLYLSPDAMADTRVAALVERAHGAGSAVFTLGTGVLERVSDTVTPQPVLAVMRFVDVPLDEVCTGVRETVALVVVCADVRDPGNAGTIVRSAAGAGARAVIFCEGSVDPYNPKTARSSAGALFQVPLALGGAPDAVLAALATAGFRLIGASAHGGTDYSHCDLGGRVAIVVGNEAWGVDPAVAALLHDRITIPLSSGVESLNVGMAAAILCFEAGRQRREQATLSGGSSVAGAA